MPAAWPLQGTPAHVVRLSRCLGAARACAPKPVLKGPVNLLGRLPTLQWRRDNACVSSNPHFIFVALCRN